MLGSPSRFHTHRHAGTAQEIADAKGWLDAFISARGQRCSETSERVIGDIRSGPPSITSDAGPVGRSGFSLDLAVFRTGAACQAHFFEGAGSGHGQ